MEPLDGFYTDTLRSILISGANEAAGAGRVQLRERRGAGRRFGVSVMTACGLTEAHTWDRLDHGLRVTREGLVRGVLA